MRNRSQLCAFAAAAVAGLAALATPAGAQTQFANINTAGGPVSGTQNYGGSLGLDFTVTDPNGIQVTRLGVFDDDQNGLATTITGYIYNLSNSQVVTGPVTFTTANSTLEGAYRFIDIPDVTLTSGTQYTVVAEGYNDAEQNGNANTGGPQVTFNETGVDYFDNRYGSAGVLPANSDNGEVGGYYAAGTFTFQPVPEPTALGVLGVGALGLLARRRTR